MTVKNVIVVQVETIKGTKADRIVLHHIGDDGLTWKIGALAAKLSKESRDVLLAAKKGDTLSVEITKDGKYWNLNSASTTTSALATTSASYTQAAPANRKETDTRIQVMNALTNAVSSLGEGKSTKEYKERVIEFVAVGNDVVDLVLSGGLDKMNKTAVISDDVVDELGF